MTDNAPALKDAAVAVLGGFAAYASVVLVLIGFLYLQASSFDRGDKKIGNKYRTVGKIGLVPFVMSNVIVWSALLDLLRSPPAISPFTLWSSGAALLALTLYGLGIFLFYLK